MKYSVNFYEKARNAKMAFNIKLIDSTEYEVERADIVDGHLEIEMKNKTAEEVETIFENSENVARIVLLQDGEEFGELVNWSKYAGVFKKDGSVIAYMTQPVDVTEQRITSVESVSAKAASDATQALSLANGIADTVNTAKAAAHSAQQNLTSATEQVSAVSVISSAAFVVARSQAQSLSDQDAIQAKILYDEWADLCKESYVAQEIGFKFVHKNQLYKTAQAGFRFQSQWEPGSQGTESIYTLIDEEHAGTQEDPIPYKKNMELFNGKYYTQNDVSYLCIRDSGIPMQYDLANLISGGFVQVVES